MKRMIVSILLSAALAMGTLAGCSGNACEEAADKLEDCGFTGSGAGGGGGGDGECTADAECISNCILDASCSEILDFLNLESDYYLCLAECE